MSTSAGVIYTTDNAGRNWKAQVRETIDATLNRVSSSGVQGASYFAGSVNSILTLTLNLTLTLTPNQGRARG